MAAIFSRWRLYGILVLKKLEVQLKMVDLTREENIYYKRWTQGGRWALNPPTPANFRV